VEGVVPTTVMKALAGSGGPTVRPVRGSTPGSLRIENGAGGLPSTLIGKRGWAR